MPKYHLSRIRGSLCDLFLWLFCFLSFTGPRGLLFSRLLILSMGLWSEQERWYLKAEDVQACVWVGFESKGLLTPKAEMAVEQCTWLRETWVYFYLKPDCGRQNHMFGTLFKSNGSRGTQKEAILALDVRSQQLCVLREREVNTV